MRLNVIDGNGELVQVIVPGAAEVIVDASTVIVDGSTPQDVLDANPDRSGYFIQVAGQAGGVTVFLNDLGDDASSSVTQDNGSIQISGGQMFPPVGYPLSTARVSVLGPTGTAIIVREW